MLHKFRLLSVVILLFLGPVYGEVLAPEVRSLLNTLTGSSHMKYENRTPATIETNKLIRK